MVQAVLERLSKSMLSVFYHERGSDNRRKAHKNGLPLLLPSPLHPSIPEDEIVLAGKLVDAYGDLGEELLSWLHYASKHLHFWKTRAQGSEDAKMRFMILERGPWAFMLGVAQIVRDAVWESSATKGLISAASNRINERVTVLTVVQCKLASALGQMHNEVDKLAKELTKGGQRIRRALSTSLISIFKAVAALEGSYDLPQTDYHSFGKSRTVSSIVLELEELPYNMLMRVDWTDEDIDVAWKLLLDNLDKFRNFLHFLMQQYRRPRTLTRHWVRCSGGAIGFALASGWLISHSRLGGSDDLDQWLKKGSEAVSAFIAEHVHQPLVSIRDELFETFRKRHHGTAELGDVKLTAESLHRMLLAFVEQVAGQRLDSSATEQQMMEIMMGRYEHELMHPVKNLLGGELARALLIQVQKLKLDIETAMLELNQILRANEINFAILAALPAFFAFVGLGYLIRRPFLQGKKVEGRGRVAQLWRRMLMAEVEKGIMCFQMMLDEGQEEEAVWRFGMVIYALDKLYKAVERPSMSSGEWSSLRADILDLASPRLATYYKLAIAARMERVYDCLVPLPTLR